MVTHIIILLSTFLSSKRLIIYTLDIVLIASILYISLYRNRQFEQHQKPAVHQQKKVGSVIYKVDGEVVRILKK